MSRLLLLSGLVVLGVGCAGTQANSRAGEPAFSLGQGAGEPLRVQGSVITGPSSSLVINDDTLRGRYRDMPVSLKWTWQDLTGAVGSYGTRMELAEGDDTRVWGSFGGMGVDLTLNGDWLYGSVGACGYVLKRNEAGFAGQRTCGGLLEEGLQVAFGAPLLERPLGEKAALLTLMLVNTTSTYTPNLSMAQFTRPRTPLVGNGQQKGN
ncbi:hypothetical protein [Vitiosangium sp. GDMCC 1.1324]|uniref:hypothetical protein n=1 Tax=Vitiosangium sp. (strain GDMCC 1.1324) TaxID=2138576 RepID=UPI000D34C262|nr:hypothetical protein [Vitiosangium sp. GDMCC 1.1324]PTL81238.1 hypothetical protein DAT35_24270 [Vitiosangium sp. GDMCC 1.1324]